MCIHSQQLSMIFCGEMSDIDTKKAMEVTKQDNIFLDQFKGKLKTTQSDIEYAMKYSPYYKEVSKEDIQIDAGRVYKKLQIVNV